MATMTRTRTGSQTVAWGEESTSPRIVRISGNIHGFSWERERPQTRQPEIVYQQPLETPASGRSTGAGPPPQSGGSFTVGSLLGRYRKIMFLDVIITIILMWICLPIFWSSLSQEHSVTDPLVAWFVNLEPNGELGATFYNATFGAPKIGKTLLTWKEIRVVPGEEMQIADRVMRGEAWVAVVVSSNATSALDEARQSGNVDYDPASAITVYYVSARHEIAMATYILPAVHTLLLNTTDTFATRSAQAYLSSLVSQNGTVNSTALGAITRAPQTISPGVSWKDVDLSDRKVPVSQAATFVGLIYICIIAYITVLTHVREISHIKDRMTTSSFRNFCFFSPIIAYIPLSLNYALINLSFRLPFGEKFPGVGSFFLFAIYTYLGMCALGLALEVVTLVLTLDYAIFFFVLWLTINLATIVLPLELQRPVFRYGVVFPFKNMYSGTILYVSESSSQTIPCIVLSEQAVRSIVFNTSDNLRNNAIVLVLWILVSFVTLNVVIWMKWTRIGTPTSGSQNRSRRRGVAFMTDVRQLLRDLRRRVTELIGR